MDPRWIIPFAANLVLLVLMREANHYLAQLGVSVFVAGLVLPVVALRLSRAPAMLAVVFTGLAIDSLGPTVFGSTALLFACALLLIRAIRHRLLRENFSTHIAVALVANLLLFTAQPLLAGADAAYATPTPARIAVDLALSQLALAALAWWFFTLQERALALWGVNLSEELRQDH